MCVLPHCFCQCFFVVLCSTVERGGSEEWESTKGGRVYYWHRWGGQLRDTYARSAIASTLAHSLISVAVQECKCRLQQTQPLMLPWFPVVNSWRSMSLQPAGSGPATGFLKQSGVHMDSKGFVPVNKVETTMMTHNNSNDAQILWMHSFQSNNSLQCHSIAMMHKCCWVICSARAVSFSSVA